LRARMAIPEKCGFSAHAPDKSRALQLAHSVFFFFFAKKSKNCKIELAGSPATFVFLKKSAKLLSGRLLGDVLR